ncbi:hypothetical protein FKM82_030746 [Ascaphus truei]
MCAFIFISTSHYTATFSGRLFSLGLVFLFAFFSFLNTNAHLVVFWELPQIHFLYSFTVTFSHSFALIFTPLTIYKSRVTRMQCTASRGLTLCVTGATRQESCGLVTQSFGATAGAPPSFLSPPAGKGLIAALFKVLYCRLKTTLFKGMELKSSQAGGKTASQHIE